MLEQVKHKSSWIWLASGKHPTAGDYFRVGHENALLTAFADWVENGYQQLTHGGARVGLNSWRFWFRGPKKQLLISGVSRDSTDKVGRSYPFVVIGLGQLQDWESNWELLPFALENAWNQIEYLSMQRFLDFRHFEERIRFLPTPAGNWSEYGTRRDLLRRNNPWTTDASGESNHINSRLKQNSDQAQTIIPLNGIESDRQFGFLVEWLCWLKRRNSVAPTTVFMGGTPDKTRLILFDRPLAPGDYRTLWSPQAAERE
jgi:type VI secretion system protein VasJ